jgi:folate-binding protein YgfZ
MRTSPLRTLEEKAGATFAPYGPPEADVLVVESFGELELEYAALRKGCVLIDQPQRGLLEITGPDRIAFLNRMVTQELKDVAPGQVRRSFWLNRKGRVDADLTLIELGDRMIVDLDVHAVDRAIKGLSAFIITEDVQIADRTEATHSLALHGPMAGALLGEVVGGIKGAEVAGLTSGSAVEARIGLAKVVIARDDSTGESGFELIIPAGEAVSVYQRLMEAGHSHEESRFNLRPAGWHAYNIARIEAGTPLYNIDFGPDSLPHETGVLRERVNFRKGCYLGQEIVARMESRGHSKRTLVGLACEVGDPSRAANERAQPVSGGQVWSAETPEGEPVGVVTSSTLAPMLGWTPICFAAVKPGSNAAGAKLVVAAEDERIGATVQQSLKFWKRGGAQIAR